MKRFINFSFLFTIFCLVLLSASFGQKPEYLNDARFISEPEVFYYGSEINGVLAGYGITVAGQFVHNQKEMLLIKEMVLINQTVLGGEVTTELKFEYHVDPETRAYFYCSSDISQASVHAGSEIIIKGNLAYFTSRVDGSEKQIELPKDVLLENPHYYHHLIETFSDGKTSTLDCEILDVTRGEVQKKAYIYEGTERLHFNGVDYETLVVKDVNYSTGASTKMWLEKNLGFPLQIEMPNSVRVFLSDRSVIKKITTANLDEILFGKVGKLIPDIMGITRMEVKARINTTGEWRTPEDLNVPNQVFKGTVTDNLIDGVFTISHPRYFGENAPEMGFDYSKEKALKKYLEPEDYIESDDPVLIKESQKITANASNTWDATVRLSQWVSDNIDGAVPGGITARKVYETRAGECGGHSRLLTALCRASNIPARMVIGCMYSSYYGGSFGQHAWVEVYMGEDGWIPVDATIGEVDYVDCGHIRLGEKTSFNPVQMEILSYEINGQPGGSTSDPIENEKYDKYLGDYQNLQNNRSFKVTQHEGSLVITIPGNMPLALNDADENGYWYARLTNRLYFEFPENEEGYISGLVLHQITPMRKISDPDTIPDEVPEELRSHLGTYHFAQMQANFVASWRNNSIAIYDPFDKVHVGLQAPDENGRWLDEFNQNKIEFIIDEEGKVESLQVLSNVPLVKGKLGAAIIKEAITTHGITAAISQYENIKNAEVGEFVLTERQMNLLGYDLLNEKKVKEALEIFKLNVSDYPNSWNVYDSLGEAYMVNGEKELAIKNYKKSIELNPENENGRNKLLEMGVKE